MTTMLVDSISSYSLRSIKLFTFGCTLAVVLMTFQYEHKLRLFNSPRLMLTLPALSLISICGFGAALVGLVYPMFITTIDQTSFPEYNDNIIRKSQVCKSIVIFVGINHLSAKIPFQSDLHFTLTLAFLCIAFWWWFDRTIITFIFSIFVSFILTMITEILLRSGALQYTYSDFYLKTCVPCLTFAGAILTIQITKLLSQPDQPLSTMDNSHEQEHVKNE
ncbi:unnamed protein product [Adineta steineri]|uniref:Uncharacterized protein n=1 Tax=Adineta steineri TaxID=433720 RepID=A0A814UXJ7_9BILA|nr:unnamed protein product [Adineta steineri]CAF1158294.1 unnamed protein product [Adineta steineri]CAF1179792.1 unnamed protein product [Adineta steineri]CAF1218639.1 unnamed protein product [Adineta steineri]CAF1310741.1 unnamed protein product [Adineta steineri]